MLRTTGAAIGAVVGGAGVAAASHFSPGDCAETKFASMTYGAACPARNYTGYLDGGVRGQVLQTCTDSDGVEWAYFSPGQTIIPVHWIRAANLEPC